MEGAHIIDKIGIILFIAVFALSYWLRSGRKNKSKENMHPRLKQTSPPLTDKAAKRKPLVSNKIKAKPLASAASASTRIQRLVRSKAKKELIVLSEILRPPVSQR